MTLMPVVWRSDVPRRRGGQPSHARRASPTFTTVGVCASGDGGGDGASWAAAGPSPPSSTAPASKKMDKNRSLRNTVGRSGDPLPALKNWRKKPVVDTGLQRHSSSRTVPPEGHAMLQGWPASVPGGVSSVGEEGGTSAPPRRLDGSDVDFF